LSALTGDNVVESLGGMPWYEGQTILEHLEALEPADVYEKRKSTFSSKRYSTKTEKNTTILEDMPVNCTETILKLEMHNGISFFNRIESGNIHF
jgi:translation elongation factor EF-1alpha